MNDPVIPCPTCPEGWRPLDKEHCAECYEGKIERLRSNVIEECAKVLDEAAHDWRRIRDPGMANNAAAYARRIRALAVSKDSLREAVEYVVDKFKKDEAQGYHTKDREFAITILDKALALSNGEL